ncbi:MAG: hypothetical protein P8X79_20335 [Reinekea sp.]
MARKRFLKRKQNQLLSGDQAILFRLIREQIAEKVIAYIDDNDGCWWYINADVTVHQKTVMLATLYWPSG